MEWVCTQWWWQWVTGTLILTEDQSFKQLGSCPSAWMRQLPHYTDFQNHIKLVIWHPDITQRYLLPAF